MTVEYVNGDMFVEPAIAHGCNIHGVMGAGVATIVRARFPDAYRVYVKACAAGAFGLGDVQRWTDGTATVFNLGTQVRPGRDARLDAIELAVTRLVVICELEGIPVVGVPRLGCGIGGLDWEDVRDAIERAAAGSAVVVRVYTL